jgi:hypothetical protein
MAGCMQKRHVEVEKRDEARIGRQWRVSCGRIWPAMGAPLWLTQIDRQIRHHGTICHVTSSSRFFHPLTPSFSTASLFETLKDTVSMGLSLSHPPYMSKFVSCWVSH